MKYLVVAGVASVIAASVPWSSHSSREHRIALAAAEVRLQLPAGWSGRIVSHAEPGPTQLALMLQAASFRLPKRDDDFGRSASRKMRPDDVRLVLMEFPPEQVGTEGFDPVRLPVRLRAADFASAPRVVSPAHDLARRHFAAARRAFALFVEFGRRKPTLRQVALANSVLSALAVAPRPELAPRVWRALRRPLQLRPTHLGSCPRAHVARTTSAAAFPLGPGPVYPSLGSPRGVIDPADDVLAHGWYLHKTLWSIAPSYRGPVLVRGRRIDLTGAIRFQWDVHELRVARVAGPSRWRYVATSTGFRGPGCYAFEIDGTGFTTVVRFEVAT